MPQDTTIKDIDSTRNANVIPIGKLNGVVTASSYQAFMEYKN